MTKVATVDLIVYGVMGALVVLTFSYHKRLRNAKEDDCAWSRVAMTWLVALLVAGLFVGGKYMFQQLGKSKAISSINRELEGVAEATLPTIPAMSVASQPQ